MVHVTPRAVPSPARMIDPTTRLSKRAATGIGRSVEQPGALTAPVAKGPVLLPMSGPTAYRFVLEFNRTYASVGMKMQRCNDVGQRRAA